MPQPNGKSTCHGTRQSRSQRSGLECHCIWRWRHKSVQDIQICVAHHAHHNSRQQLPRKYAFQYYGQLYLYCLKTRSFIR